MLKTLRNFQKMVMKLYGVLLEMQAQVKEYFLRQLTHVEFFKFLQLLVYGMMIMEFLFIIKIIRLKKVFQKLYQDFK